MGRIRQISNDELFFYGERNQDTLKRRIREDDLVPYKCPICSRGPEWNGKELVLILDHINGDKWDNRLPNLRFVCPNCNSQLPTTGGGNKGRVECFTEHTVIEGGHFIVRPDRPITGIKITGCAEYSYRVNIQQPPAKLLFLHVDGPQAETVRFLAVQGYEVHCPTIIESAVGDGIALSQMEYNSHRPEVVIEQAFGGAIAMAMNTGDPR